MSLKLHECSGSVHEDKRPCEGILTLMRSLKTDKVRFETSVRVKTFFQSEDGILAITTVVVNVLSNLISDSERFEIQPGYGTVFILCKRCGFWFSFDVCPKKA